MKKITRLMNYKTKQTKNIKTYNPFDTGDGGNDDDNDNGNDAMSHKGNKNKKKLKAKTQLEPIVHNYNQTNNAIAKTTKSKVDGNKLFTITKKSNQLQQQQPLKSTAVYTSPSPSRTIYNSGAGGSNNINYASLNRMRNNNSNSSCASQSTKVNSSNNKRKWPFLWWKRYGRNRKSKTWRLKKTKTCWRFLRKLYCCRKRSSYQYDSEDDDDIDAKFNAYVFELKRRDAMEEAEAKKSINANTQKGNCVTNSSKATTTKEAKAAAEELTQSPIMGQRNSNDPTSSPIPSRCSGSSDNWPTQSDEDIDRLVAMHQNRSSLSSLGLRSDSMASVYSGAGEGRYGTVVVKGQVEFGMQYNYKLAALEIRVVRCKDLAAVDSKRNRSDPYVKVYLLPDKSKAGKRKTKVKKHTLNPIFDEILRFHMPISSLESRTLWLTVWHSDMFGRNDFLGEVSVNLQGRVFDNPQSQWYLLQERSEPFDEVATYRGDIVVGLKYVPPEGSKSKFMRAASLAAGGGLRKFGSIKAMATSKTDRSAKGGQLHVLVKEAKHLTPIKPTGSCDAFCKSYLLPDRTRSSKQKTPVVKRSTNPSWNYTFVYEDVSLEDLSERALELTVWDHDRLASNEFLGGVRFSLGTCKSYGRQVDWMDASGKELSLWQNMLDRPNFWVEGSVILRSTLEGIRTMP